jgi:peptidoglycan/xylan/chitin deacetylase (PgdA/CDA1 family)
MRRAWAAGLGAAVIVGLTATPAMAAPSHGSAQNRGAGACSAGYVGLTFDDGPSSTTRALVTELAAVGGYATWFDTGAHAQADPSLVRLQDRVGDIGNHSYSHPNFGNVPPEPFTWNELLGTNQIIGSITGHNPTLYRPPFNVETESQAWDAHALGMTVAEYTVDTEDYAPGITASRVAAHVDGVKAGDVILMHDAGYRTTVEALPLVIAKVRSKGLCVGKLAPSATPVTHNWWGQDINVSVVKP